LDDSEDKGAVDGNLLMKNMLLILKSSPAQLAALDAFSQAQQTPGAAEYHRWLTPEEFAAHFGVAGQDLATLKNYLIAQGFSIDEIAAGGRSIKFSGTAAQVKNAFHTEMHHYVWRGENHIANNSNPQIPAALADVVDGIVNLHDFHSRSRKQLPQTQQTTPQANPLSNNSGINLGVLPISNYNIGSTNLLTPGDYGVIYNINPLYASAVNGSGVKIAILGRSDIVAADVAEFQSFAGLTANAPQTIVTNTDPGLMITSGDQLESTLDVEWAGGVAPGATVLFITSASTVSADGVLLSADYAVNHNVADIISLSYGACEASMGLSGWKYYGAGAATRFQSAGLWYQASVQGQTVLVASGDSGAAGCDTSASATATHGLAVNGFCSSPYSTCVGGTQFIDANPAQYWSTANPGGGTTTALSYIPEAVWNQSGSNLSASGGGASLYAAKPSWQASPGVPADGARDVPDVALAAATLDPYIIYMNGSQTYVGGTSAATPSLAGIMALVNQYNGGRQGNINPTLYGLYQLQVKNSLGFNYFHPTVSGNNSVPGLTGFTATGAGYDQATGLGSVDANLLVTQWRNLNPGATSVTLSSTTAKIIAGQTVTFTATVSGFHPTGRVQFLTNGANLGSAVALSNGVASLTTALSTPGGDSVTAVYSGDGNNLTSASTAQAETVLTASTITISVSAASVTVGQSLTITATVTGATPTGTVQFYSNGLALGAPVSLVNGVAVLTTNSLSNSGLDSLTATYSGDSNNGGNTSAAIAENVVQQQIVPALSVWQNMLLAVLLFMLLVWIQRKLTRLAINSRGS
jgi:subtilase family serine protease